MPVVLHGPAYSTYARSVRLALEEKGVPYELNEVHLLGGEGQKPERVGFEPTVPRRLMDQLSRERAHRHQLYIPCENPGSAAQSRLAR